MTIAAGKRNRRIAIQSQSKTQDAFGQQVSTWETIYACWAGIANVSGKRLFATSGFVSQTSHEITMLWTSAVVVTPAHRVMYIETAIGVTHIYEVKAILDTDQAQQEIVLLVYELNGAE